jgi:ribosomal protein S18 acetylase RimI-like enzyme
MSGSVTLRPAKRTDAASMAVLVDIAGYGLPAWLWRAAVRRGEAVSVLEVGRMRALRDESSFSWRNTTIADLDGEVAGMLTGYRQPDEPEKVDLAEIDPILRPLFELEPLSPGTWYINVLATFAEHRGKGVGTALMGEASSIARRADARGLSLIVEDDNTGARRFYERLGFTELARRPFRVFPGGQKAEHWVLMEKMF